ncbi:MAG: SIS domain-containing protein [Spirosomataceae bacterium]
MTVVEDYLHKCKGILQTVENQQEAIHKAAKWFTDSILVGRMVHVFGSGHSRIMVEEMWPRYGSFAGFNPIVELSLTFHNLVVGANGQRQAMFLENVAGLADRILRNFDLSGQDTALVISSSGTNIVPVEMAEIFQQRGIKVVALVTSLHSAASASKRADGKKLTDFADLILDTGAPVGDAMVYVPNLDTPIAPGSTVGGAMLINCLKVETARLLTEAGHPPKSSVLLPVGAERATSLLEAAYDEHAHRIVKMYQKVGIPSYVSSESLSP